METINKQSASSLRAIILAVVMMSAGATFACGPHTFGITPGNMINGATFGFPTSSGNLEPYFGLQYLGGSTTYMETGKRYDPMANAVVDYEDIYKVRISGIIPTVGVRYFVHDFGKIRTFANANLSYAFLSGKLEDSDNEQAEKDFKDQLKNTSAFGFLLGYGAEYKFDDYFGIAGEVGFRMLKGKTGGEFEQNIPGGTNTATWEQKGRLTPGFARVSFYFYIPGQE